MKVKGEILESILYPGKFWWLLKAEENHSQNKYYNSKSSARRAANRVAKKLGLEVEWEKEGK